MRTAVIGVRVMGSAIAARLIATGASVALFDAAPGKCDALEQQGASVAASARGAAAAADYVITSPTAPTWSSALCSDPTASPPQRARRSC